jgi:hypothetical protein
MAAGDVTVTISKPLGKGLRFNGATPDWVDCGYDSSLDITDEITIMVWLKPDVGCMGYILSKNDTNVGDSQYGIYVAGNNARYYGGGAPTSAVASLPNNVWTHLVFIRQGGRGQFYINGVASGASAACTLPTKPTFPVRLGCRWDAAAPPPLHGIEAVMDNLHIFNRALSPKEIDDAYNGRKLDRTGLVALWSFNDISDPGHDDSGTGNDGTLNGTPSSVGGHNTVEDDVTTMRVDATDQWNFVDLADGQDVMTIHIEN